MGLAPFKVTRLRRQTSTSGVTGSPSPTDSGTQTATSGQTSATDTSQSNAPASSTATSEAPTSSVASSSDTSTPTVSTAPVSSSSVGSSSEQNTAPSSSNTPTSSRSVPVVSSSSASTSSQSASSSSASTPSSSSTTPSSTSTSISPTSSSTSSSSTASSTTSSPTSTSTSTLASTSSRDLSTTSTSSHTHTSSDSTTESLTTITSSIVTTINGHPTTVATTFPTTLNSPPSTAPSSGRRTGIIAGSAIAAGLLILSILSGLFIFYRRRKLRKISLAHRALPTPRSALLADEDGFDLTDSGPSRLMGESGDRRSAAPQLLRARGLETGSIFHEGVWPPPGERSRLEDPLLVGSTVDLTSIVDDIMGAGDQHGRSISADTTRSDMPLLANMSPERNSDMQKGQPSTFVPRSRLAASSSDAYSPELTPLNPSGHERQLSDDRSPGVPSSSPAAGPPAGAVTSAAVDRVKSGRSMMSVSTTGSPPPEFTHLHGGGRAGVAGTGFGLGSLIVVNATPEAEREELERGRDQREEREREQPLVDLRTKPEDTPPREIPPLYHMIPRNASDTWAGAPPQQEASSGADAASHAPQSLQSPQSPPSSTSGHFGLAM